MIQRSRILLYSLTRNVLKCPSVKAKCCVRSFSLTVSSIRPIMLPALSPTMTQGSIAVWKKEPGAELNPGDLLCEIETDKASVGLEVQDEGVLAKILYPAGISELNVGTPIALVVDSVQEYNEFLKLDPKSYEQFEGVTSIRPTEVPVINEKTIEGKLSPAARHLVETKSLDVSSVRGSVKHGRIVTKGDVLKGIQTGQVKISQQQNTTHSSTQISQSSIITPSTAIPSSSPTQQLSQPSNFITNEPINNKYKDIPNSNMRKVIAKRLTESKATVPHLYLSIEANIDSVLALRKELKKKYDVNISVNDIVIKAAALALRDVPEAYYRWNKLTSSIEAGTAIDISVAVATPSGLITPILTNAEKRGLVDINSKVKDLAGRARDGKLKPEEYQGGAFSISNLGMYGITSFSAVINPPQSCILAVGSGVSRVVPSIDKDGKPKPKVVTVVTVQLSSDRRVVDEATAGLFLQTFSSYLSDPKNLLL